MICWIVAFFHAGWTTEQAQPAEKKKPVTLFNVSIDTFNAFHKLELDIVRAKEKTGKERFFENVRLKLWDAYLGLVNISKEGGATRQQEIAYVTKIMEILKLHQRPKKPLEALPPNWQTLKEDIIELERAFDVFRRSRENQPTETDEDKRLRVEYRQTEMLRCWEGYVTSYSLMLRGKHQDAHAQFQKALRCVSENELRYP